MSSVVQDLTSLRDVRWIEAKETEPVAEGAKNFRFETSVAVTSEAPLQVVYDTIADLRAHLEWAGERASDDDFRLLTIEAPDGAG